MSFGGLLALGGVDLDVVRGERLAVLGPNGAGKTTLFNVIAGDIRPTEGTVLIKAIDCTSLPSRLRPQLGVARTYQKTRLLTGLTVEDNLLPRPDRQGQAPPGRCGGTVDDDEHARTGTPGAASGCGSAINWITVVGDLSHGQQRQLEVGMALVTDPDLIMLDEPASGLSRGERERLSNCSRHLPRSTTLLLIEHDMDVALRVADRVVVMADGEVVASGTPDEIRQQQLVHAIYLGQAGG